MAAGFVVGTPGTLARDSEAGRTRIAAALTKFEEYCRSTATPFPCHRGNLALEVEEGEPVESASLSGLEGGWLDVTEHDSV